MIDLTRNNSPAEDMTQLEATQAMALAYAMSASTCECGNPKCDYDPSLPIAEDQQAIAEALVLESPILRLVKERNEARELVKRLLRATDGVTDSKEYYAAMLEAHRAEMRWKGGAQ